MGRIIIIFYLRLWSTCSDGPHCSVSKCDTFLWPHLFSCTFLDSWSFCVSCCDSETQLWSRPYHSSPSVNPPVHLSSGSYLHPLMPSNTPIVVLKTIISNPKWDELNRIILCFFLLYLLLLFFRRANGGGGEDIQGGVGKASLNSGIMEDYFVLRSWLVTLFSLSLFLVLFSLWLWQTRWVNSLCHTWLRLRN